MAVEFRYRPRDLDNQLVTMLSAGRFDANEVRRLVAAGADINSPDPWGEGPLEGAIMNLQDGLPIDAIRLLLELGADPNQEDDEGGRPLVSACFSGVAEIVRLLLQHGANPNFVSFDHPESLLDIAEFDQYYHEKIDPSERMVAAYSQVIPMLRAAGAKNLKDMEAPGPRRWIAVSGYYRTGLLTGDGNLNIDSIPGLSSETLALYREWAAERFDPWPVSENYTVPAGFDRAAHVDRGLQLARQIKVLLGPTVRVDYWYIDPAAERQGSRRPQSIRDIQPDSIQGVAR